jgi:hypothetical protein
MTVAQMVARSPFATPEQVVGIEIEAEGVSPDRKWDEASVLSWDVRDDGSLRGENVELVSQPLSISLAREQIPRIYAQLNAYGGYGSIRTGIHVHFDMLSRTLEEVGAICTFYSLVEPALYATLPPDREQNIYCVPWYRAPNEAAHMYDLLHEQPNERMRRFNILQERCCKYTGLNLQCLYRFGTLEFRMAPTFATAQELVAWLDTLGDLVETASHFRTPEEVLSAVAADGIDSMWPNASELAEKYDAYYVAEIIGGKHEITWEAPLLDLSDNNVTQVTEEEQDEETRYVDQMLRDLDDVSSLSSIAYSSDSNAWVTSDDIRTTVGTVPSDSQPWEGGTASLLRFNLLTEENS